MTWDLNSRRVTLLGHNGLAVDLHLRPLVASMTASMQCLYQWQICGLGLAKGVRQPPLAIADSIPPLMPPRASNFLGNSTPMANGEVATVNAGTALAIQRTLDSTVATAEAFAQIERNRNADGWTPFESIRELSFETIGNLANAGALVTQRGEFGELELKTVATHTKFVNVLVLQNPVLDIFTDECIAESKLDVVLSLLRAGWRHVAKPSPHKPDADKKFVNHIKKPTSYFVCLASCGELFARSIPEIKHDQKDVYYQALLRLRGAKLQEFLAKMHEGVDMKWCRKALKAETLPPIVDCPAQELESDEEPDDDDTPEDAFRQVALVPRILPSLEWKRCRVQDDSGTVVKVYFDHCSSQNAQQRCWSNCVIEGHVNCFQWRQTGDFNDRDCMAAYMFCWATSQGFESREIHMAYRPSDQIVEAKRPQLRMTEW